MEGPTTEGVHLDLQVDSWPVSLDVAMPTGLVVNELLTNALKHAGPTEAEVNVRWSEEALELQVTDAGRGGTVPVTGPGGHGIDGMRERAAALGGSFEFDRGEPAGTHVTVRLPLAAQA